jgi:aspartyl-tRNA(Asn)/glutamyl-tRNA(Gln) amidotransferase subunit A
MNSSAVVRLDAALARVEASPSIGKTFTAVFADTARREAEAADRRATSGTKRGAFDGRIITTKALFDVAGTVTTSGSAVLRALPPAVEDALVLKRLRATGAVIIGETQMTEFAFSALGTNPHDGMPGNPRDRSRVPGGSSSGAVVSVFDKVAEIAIGSDTGGSVRIPAVLSGAVGFKPTSGRIPTVGAFSLSSSLDTIGPIGMSVADCIDADAIMAEKPIYSSLLLASVDELRLTVPRGRLFDRCEQEVLSAFDAAMLALRDAGANISEGSIDTTLDDVANIDKIGTFPSIELGATLKGYGISELDGVDPKTRVRIEAGANVSGVDYVHMLRLRQTAIRKFEQSFAGNEILVLPTCPIRAPALSEIESDANFHEINGLLLRNPRTANMLDCPSVSLPLPVQDGDLPIGLMLIGCRGSDRHLLRIASRVETLLQVAITGALRSARSPRLPCNRPHGAQAAPRRYLRSKLNFKTAAGSCNQSSLSNEIH